jgi:hypothetical protein
MQSRAGRLIGTVLLLLGFIGGTLLSGRLLAEQHCNATGGKWHGHAGECTPPQTECLCGSRRLPVGTVFGDGCNTCECERHGWRCTALACFDSPSVDLGGTVIGCFAGMKQAKPCTLPGDTRCIFDPGCEEPRSYRGTASFAPERAHCGCDGATFIASAPHRPYRHVGACGPEPSSSSR